MLRGTGFGGEHVEKAVDERLIVRRHVRDRASAAIIRAVKSWPVRLRLPIAWYMCAAGSSVKLGVWNPVPVRMSTVPAWPRDAAESIIRVQLVLRPRPRP